jgi:acyl carrier protein
MLSLAPERALEALEQVLGRGAAQLGAFDIDWPRFLAQFPEEMRTGLLSDMRRRFSGAARPAAQPDLLQMIEDAPESERRSLVLGHVRREVMGVLRLDPARPIDIDQGLFEAGMDSLMALELKNRLQRSLARPVPATLVFEYGTVRAIADYVAAEISGRRAPAAAAEPLQETRLQSRAALTSTLSGLSENQVAELLSEELTRLKQRRSE